MLLLTLHEWLGPPRFPCKALANWVPKERTVALATAMPLGDALARIKGYESAFSAKGSLVIEYRLLSVSVIEAQAPELLASFDVFMVESLKQSPEELD